jgi:hypothetical protein
MALARFDLSDTLSMSITECVSERGETTDDGSAPCENLLENLLLVLAWAEVENRCSSFVKLWKIIFWAIALSAFIKDEFAYRFKQGASRCDSTLRIILTSLETARSNICNILGGTLFKDFI